MGRHGHLLEAKRIFHLTELLTMVLEYADGASQRFVEMPQAGGRFVQYLQLRYDLILICQAFMGLKLNPLPQQPVKELFTPLEDQAVIGEFILDGNRLCQVCEHISTTLL